VETTKEADLPLAIAGTGYGVIGILVIILLVVLVFYFLRRA
jgi:predicted cation transporter